MPPPGYAAGPPGCNSRLRALAPWRGCGRAPCRPRGPNRTPLHGADGQPALQVLRRRLPMTLGSPGPYTTPGCTITSAGPPGSSGPRPRNAPPISCDRTQRARVRYAGTIRHLPAFGVPKDGQGTGVHALRDLELPHHLEHVARALDVDALGAAALACRPRCGTRRPGERRRRCRPSRRGSILCR